MSTTHHATQIEAPPAQVYRALLDPLLIPQWRVPTGMRCEVHEFEPREGGAFRVSLTYDSPTSAGKSTAHTDTYHGHFEQLIPNERVVERLEFETTNPLMQGEMRIDTHLAAVVDGTSYPPIEIPIPHVAQEFEPLSPESVVTLQELPLKDLVLEGEPLLFGLLAVVPVLPASMAVVEILPKPQKGVQLPKNSENPGG